MAGGSGFDIFIEDKEAICNGWVFTNTLSSMIISFLFSGDLDSRKAAESRLGSPNQTS